MVLGTNNPFPRSVGSFQVPVAAPDVDPDSSPTTTVCFSTDWLPVVLGALQQLTLQATWLGDDDAVQLAQDRAMLLLSMFGGAAGGCTTALCITGAVYDDDCDCILWTIPGTEITVENPSLDPRHAEGFRYPPIVADDPRCQAAANMTRFISDLLDEVILVVDTAGNAEGLLAILLPFLVELGPFGILIDLVLALGFVLFSAGAAAIAAAFTSTVYDQLTCIFFCNIDIDGTVTADELAQILADIDVQIGGLVSTVLSAMFFLMGEVGLSNAGAVGDAPADCDACVCTWCYTWDFTIDDGGWTPDTYGTYVPAVGWQLNLTPSAIMIGLPIVPDNSMRTITIEYDNGGGTGIMAAYWYDGSYHSLGTAALQAGAHSDPIFHDTTTIDVPNIFFNANGDNGAVITITRITIEGDYGDNPFGTDNC